VNNGENVIWCYNLETKTLTISGTGAMNDYSGYSQPWKDYMSDITTAVIEEGVTSISNRFLYGCTALTSVTIGSSVTTIGASAFNGCTALTSVTIGSSVTTIGASAFYGCTSLATISGAAGVTTIESSAFDDTAWYNGLPDGLTTVGHVAYRFKGDGTSVTLPDGTTQIYNGAFGNTAITSIIIPTTVTRIGDRALASSALRKVYCLASEPPALSAYSFDESLPAIIVPADAYSYYKKGYWYPYISQIQPGYTITCEEGITATTDGPLVAEDEVVTLSHNDRAGYEFNGYSVKDSENCDVEVDEEEGVYTFQMPANDVTVSARWSKLLSNTDITITAIDDQVWKGSAIMPTVTVWDNMEDISSECEFAYSDNQDTGTATVTITAKETSTGYSGSTTIKFNIVPKNVGDYGAVQILEDQYGRHGVIDGKYAGSVAINLEEDVEVADVTFNRTFPTDGYSTIVLPFSVKTSELCGVDSVLSFAGIVEENGMLECAMQVVWEETLETVDLQAYTPYIVRTNRSNISITGYVAFEATRDAFTERDNWEYRGIYSYKVWDQNSPDLGTVYGFAANKVEKDKIEIGDFVRVSAGAYIYPLRAYLIYKEEQSNAPRRAMTLDELPDRIPVRIIGRDGTGIVEMKEMKEMKEMRNAEWYSIDGRKLNGKPTAKGVYILNGKKRVIK
jgi:hypothetical protein